MKKTKLSIEEREKIFYYLTLNKSYQDIGLLLARSHTTISREMKKNTIEGGDIPPRAPSIKLDLGVVNAGGKIKSIPITIYLKKSFKEFLKNGLQNK